MNKIAYISVAVLAAFLAGVAADRYFIAPDAALSMDGENAREPLYWVAPMDPNYRRDQPGKSPMGMDLIPVYRGAETGKDEATVTIAPQVQHNLGVRTDTAVIQPLASHINTVGFAAFAEDRLSHIHIRVDGWIGGLQVTSTGDRVTAGQKLFDLYSPELVNVQEEYLAALRSGSQGLVSAAQDKLLSLGLSEQQIQRLQKSGSADQYLAFYAPRSGYVSHLSVRPGMFITPANEILAVGELDPIWVIGEIFERQANWIQPGQRVEVTSESYPNRIWLGAVDYIYPILDVSTRTLRVRIRIPNADEALKPNMLVDLKIHGEQAEPVLTIAREALIETERMTRVVKVLDGDRFTAVRVKSGRRTQGRVEIIEGLSAGDRVVSSAQFLIDSESNLNADLLRMEEVPAAKSMAPPDQSGRETSHPRSAPRDPKMADPGDVQ